MGANIPGQTSSGDSFSIDPEAIDAALYRFAEGERMVHELINDIRNNTIIAGYECWQDPYGDKLLGAIDSVTTDMDQALELVATLEIKLRESANSLLKGTESTRQYSVTSSLEGYGSDDEGQGSSAKKQKVAESTTPKYEYDISCPYETIAGLAGELKGLLANQTGGSILAGAGSNIKAAGDWEGKKKFYDAIRDYGSRINSDITKLQTLAERMEKVAEVMKQADETVNTNM